VPAATPVTTPPFTVAIDVLLDAQVIARFVTTLPSESFTVASKFAVFPVRMLADAGDTVTLPTGTALTVTDDVPDFPSLVAVMVTVPGAKPVTIPLVDTIAWLELLDDHVTARSVTTFPFTSRTTAFSCTLVLCKIVGPCGCTVTDPTATFVTVNAAVPFLPSLVAVIVLVP
jgi:hypothetical protein